MSKKTSRRVVNAKFQQQLPPIEPQSHNQHRLIQSIINDDVTFALGSAGTGKTWVSATLATDLWLQGDYEKIIVTKPTVPAGEDLGALPGELDEKFGPWVDVVMQPIKDRLRYHPGKYEAATTGLKRNIEAKPLYLLRGATFNRSIVILDEAQNATPEQIRMLCTRIGRWSKLIICGDTKQCDLGDQKGGLEWIIPILQRRAPDIEVINFTLEDCARGDICKRFLTMFEQEA